MEDAVDNIYGKRAYASTAILARRERILEVALSILVEEGVERITVGQLTKRAGVGSRTIYHAFGDREGVIAHAIAAYMADILADWADGAMANTAPEILLECDRAIAVAIRQRKLVKALVALYFSPALRPEIRAQIVQLPQSRIRRWLAYAEERGELIRNADLAFFEQRQLDAEFSLLNDWSRGLVEDAQLVPRYRACFITTALAAADGPSREYLIAALVDALDELQQARGIISYTAIAPI